MRRYQELRVGTLVIVLALLVGACAGESVSTTSAPAGETTTTVEGAPSTSAVDQSTTTAGDFNAEQYFEGQKVTMIPTSPPGGGTDLIARLVASYIGDFIPGRPNVVVSNLERMSALNLAYRESDGFSIIGIGGVDSAMTRQILPEAEYDVRNVNLIGAFASQPTTYLMDGSLPISDFRDAIGQSEPVLRYAAAVAGAEGLQGPRLVLSWMCDRLEMSCELLQISEDDFSTQLVMIERREINLLDTTIATALNIRSEELTSGTLRFFAMFDVSEGAIPSLPDGVDAPPILEDNLPAELLDEWVEVIGPAVEGTFAQHYWVGPDVPQEVVQVYRDAFEEMMANEDIADAFENASRVTFTPVPAEVGQELMRVQTESFLANLDAFSAIQEELFSKYWEQ